MPDARQFQAVLTASGDQGWTVTVPEVGQASTDDAALADIEARRLIRQHLGLGLNEADDLDLQLVDEQHRPIFVFDLLFTSYPGDQPAASDTTHLRLAENPPPGCAGMRHSVQFRACDAYAAEPAASRPSPP